MRWYPGQREREKEGDRYLSAHLAMVVSHVVFLATAKDDGSEETIRSETGGDDETLATRVLGVQTGLK